MISKEVLTYCKEIENWPESWEIDTPDIKTGKSILHEVFLPFFENLISEELARKTIKIHISNIWLLGGEIIVRVNFDEELRNEMGPSLVEMHIDEFGGPYSKHLDTAVEKKSFNSSCKKLYKFIKLQKPA
ncbi:MAG: hypothetical protein L3J57_14490 [Desulfuromusa sp.]|nr:hypothetical protein [Desulfuromusa sp.]